MKNKFIKNTIKILFAILLVMQITVFNHKKVEAVEDNVQYWTTSGSAEWGVDMQTGTLHIRPAYGSSYGVLSINGCPWRNISSMIRQIDVKGQISVQGSADYLFAGMNIQYVSINGYFDTGGVYSAVGMFYGTRFSNSDLINRLLTNTSQIQNAASMFENISITSLDSSRLPFGNARNMRAMFRGAQIDILLICPDTYNVTDMSEMFSGARIGHIDFQGFITSNVTNMSGMFANYSADYLNLRDFNTHNVRDMSDMFYRSGINELDLTSFDTYHVMTMQDMLNMSSIYSLRLSDNFANANLYNNVDIANTAGLMYDDWAKVRDQNGNLTYDYTKYSGVDLLSHTASTTPSLSGTWTRVQSDNYVDEYDEAHYISKQGVNANNDWVKNGDTWVYTFDVDNENTPYWLWEDQLEGYTSPYMKPGMVRVNEGGNRYYEIVNTSLYYGSLSIEKKVINPLFPDAEFEFIITIDNFPGTHIRDDVVFNDGVARIMLKDGEVKTISGLPMNSNYKVEEVLDSLYETESLNDTGTLTVGETAEVIFSNKCIPVYDNETNSIRVKKIVEGTETSDKYHIRIMLWNLDPNSTYAFSDNEYAKSNENGELIIEVDLAANEEFAVYKLPAGAIYQISEPAGDYISSFEITDEAGINRIVEPSKANDETNKQIVTAVETVDDGEEVLVTLKNKITAKTLTIEKQVIGTSEDKNKDFSINLEFYQLNPGSSITVGNQTATANAEGYASVVVTLKDDETIIIPNLPVGAQYKATEAAGDYYSRYTVADIDNPNCNTIVKKAKANSQANNILSTELETMDADENIKITFTNTIEETITLKKSVDGNMGNKTDEFIFEVVNTDVVENCVIDEYELQVEIDHNDQEYSQLAMIRYECEDGNTYMLRNGSDIYLNGNMIDIEDLHVSMTSTEKSVSFIYNNTKYEFHSTDNQTAQLAKTTTSSYTLSDGEEAFINMKYGSNYRITEQDYSSVGYRTYIGNNPFPSRTTSSDVTSSKTVIFKNIRGAAVPTEIRFWWWAGIPLVVASLAWIIYKKKKSIKI